MNLCLIGGLENGKEVAPTHGLAGYSVEEASSLPCKENAGVVELSIIGLESDIGSAIPRDFQSSR